MATDVRAVDGSEVVVRLGRREQAAGALKMADFCTISSSLVLIILVMQITL